MERTKLQFGYSADDGNGFILREGAQHIEDALSDIYMFLSGGQSQVKLPMAIPKSRGGTGATGEASSRVFVVDQGVKAFQPVLLKYVPVAYCTVGLGTAPKTHIITELNSEILFFRTGVGTYKCTVFGSIKINNDFIYVQPDNYGNQGICGVPTYEGNDIIIKVHPLVFDQVTGRFAPNTNERVDVPDSTFISFVLVNTIGAFI